MTLGKEDEANSNLLKFSKTICTRMQSEDRDERKQALRDLQSYLMKETPSDDALMNMFNETHVYLMNALRDKSEEVREKGISFLTYLYISLLPNSDFYLTYIFPVLVERIGTAEVTEESEELRFELILMLTKVILKYAKTDKLKPFLNDAVTILRETVQDKFSLVREYSCRCIVLLAGALSADFHLQAESLIEPVLTCLKNQRFKVRVEGIKCIGELIMHCTNKAVEMVIIPLAERLFDSNPLVRVNVARAAARWSNDYKDRYSYFHKFLPLILTGLNDEVEWNRQEVQNLWKEVGYKYQQEDKDLKDILDYFSEKPIYYLDHLKRPNLGCRVLVQRHLGKMAPALANELQSWQADIRLTCSQLLCSVVLHSENLLIMHLHSLLPAMFPAAKDEDPRVVDNIIRAAEILGLFVPFEAWSKLLFPQIENGLHHGHIIVLRGLIMGGHKDFISAHLDEITELLVKDSVCISRKKKFQNEMVKCVDTICQKYEESPNSFVGYRLFKILVTMSALSSNENITNININRLENLKIALNMDSLKQLWSTYLRKLLVEINIDPAAWTVVTTQACIFEVVLMESEKAFGENLDIILHILKAALNTNTDAECRLKLFSALTVPFENKYTFLENANNLTEFFEKIITEVFIPSLVWHAGKTAETMRTMAASCLRSSLLPDDRVDLFADTDRFQPLFSKLIPLLLSLLEDASGQSRLLALDCLVLLKQIAVRKNVWNTDALINIYPEMMKRLDDPTENVRENATRTLAQIFEDSPDDFKGDHYKAHHDLIIDTLLTHFDDDEEYIQDLMSNVLKVMATINKAQLKSKLERQKPLLRNQKGCEFLLGGLN